MLYDGKFAPGDIVYFIDPRPALGPGDRPQYCNIGQIAWIEYTGRIIIDLMIKDQYGDLTLSPMRHSVYEKDIVPYGSAMAKTLFE